ncbi:MAG: hypothetical protein ACR2NY_00975 [Alphaproteobacteria bacterium]
MMKKIILTLYAICLFALCTNGFVVAAHSAERLKSGEGKKMLSVVCEVDEEEKQSMRDLIDMLDGQVRVKRVQVTRGNCYLVNGRINQQKYIGLFEPMELEELFYILK